MSLERLPDKSKKSRYQRWRELRDYGEEISLSDINKIVDLNRILRRDGMKLGITQVGIEILPRKVGYIAAANDAGYRIKGDGMLAIPSSITFEYRAVDELSVEELRSLGWHEFGHYIFAYFFPKADAEYWKKPQYYLAVEMFADEFAYNKFGDVYIKAVEKIGKFAENKKERANNKAWLEDLKRMVRYRKRYNKPYWMVFAEKYGVDIEYSPKESRIVGIKPTKATLEGMY